MIFKIWGTLCLHNSWFNLAYHFARHPIFVCIYRLNVTKRRTMKWLKMWLVFKLGPTYIWRLYFWKFKLWKGIVVVGPLKPYPVVFLFKGTGLPVKSLLCAICDQMMFVTDLFNLWFAAPQRSVKPKTFPHATRVTLNLVNWLIDCLRIKTVRQQNIYIVENFFIRVFFVREKN